MTVGFMKTFSFDKGRTNYPLFFYCPYIKANQYFIGHKRGG